MTSLSFVDPTTGFEISLVPYANGEEALAALQPLIREECERRILEAVPAWQQRNAIADMLSDDNTVKAKGTAVWSKVTTLRAKSNALEASLTTMSDAEFIELDITDDKHWSE